MGGSEKSGAIGGGETATGSKTRLVSVEIVAGECSTWHEEEADRYGLTMWALKVRWG